MQCWRRAQVALLTIIAMAAASLSSCTSCQDTACSLPAEESAANRIRDLTEGFRRSIPCITNPYEMPLTIFMSLMSQNFRTNQVQVLSAAMSQLKPSLLVRSHAYRIPETVAAIVSDTPVDGPQKRSGKSTQPAIDLGKRIILEVSLLTAGEQWQCALRGLPSWRITSTHRQSAS